MTLYRWGLVGASVGVLHGMVHAEFRHHAVGRVGLDRWNVLVTEAGLASQAPRLSQRYPDADLVAAVGLLAKSTDSDVDAVLFEFGLALFPVLVATYGDLIPPGWDALDLVEHTETVIHRAVRLQDSQASPPRLTSVRVSGDQVRVLYSSERRLCSLAKGLLTGAAHHFEQDVAVGEEHCVRRGDAFCEFVLTADGATTRDGAHAR